MEKREAFIWSLFTEPSAMLYRVFDEAKPVEGIIPAPSFSIRESQSGSLVAVGRSREVLEDWCMLMNFAHELRVRGLKEIPIDILMLHPEVKVYRGPIRNEIYGKDTKRIAELASVADEVDRSLARAFQEPHQADPCETKYPEACSLPKTHWRKPGTNHCWCGKREYLDKEETHEIHYIEKKPIEEPPTNPNWKPNPFDRKP